MEHIFENIIYMYITKKDTKFGSQNFDYQIWFCTRLFMDSLCRARNKIMYVLLRRTVYKSCLNASKLISVLKFLLCS